MLHWTWGCRYLFEIVISRNSTFLKNRCSCHTWVVNLMGIKCYLIVIFIAFPYLLLSWASFSYFACWSFLFNKLSISIHAHFSNLLLFLFIGNIFYIVYINCLSVIFVVVKILPSLARVSLYFQFLLVYKHLKTQYQ